MTETIQPKQNNIDNEITFVCPVAYCDYCHTDVEFIVHKTRRYGMYHGVRYRYRGKKANCMVCGKTIQLPEILEYNMRKLVAESRKPKYKENKDERL